MTQEAQETEGNRGDREPQATSQRTVAVGIVADPGFADDLAQRLRARLERRLGETFADGISWQVHTRCETLALTPAGSLPIVTDADSRCAAEGWDMVIYLTEIPRLVGSRPLVFDLSTEHSASLLALPALGWFGVRRRLQDVVLHLVGRMARHHLGSESLEQQAQGLRRRPTVKRRSGVSEIPGAYETVESHLALKGVRGRFRLLAGMVRCNQPWRLVPEMSSAIAAAAGVAAFGIFYSSIWQMADTLSVSRLALINAFAVIAMVAWLVLRNHLWDSGRDRRGASQAMLYNASTVATLLIGVMSLYVLLFVLALVATLVVIADQFLHAKLGHPVDITDYLKIAWMISSMGAIAGAVGSSLESEAAVRRATYSRRERQRRAQEEDRAEDEPR